MWRFKPFMQKEQNGLEGRTVDVGNLKIHVRNAIAEGGFSCVYLARDAVNPSKQYALKHMICNDEESLEIVMKEISVMKSLKGHPNVVTLYGHTIFDMGRTKEALLVMEFCEKSLVSVLESRGAGYFDEKQVLMIFRDVCNAVFAMHCQSPPIAHRDLKAENLLLGSDGSWKLCDFGSTSTNHSRFERPEEMGIEEDNIRKYTTPAYRAPEMWDLYRRELINEKVDIWALGCLLFRICYFKSAFDGESKLQILNGNYRIPEMPKYSSMMTDLIRNMLQSSPDSRPDIMQVWFRINEQLPVNVQKSLPDRPPEMPSPDMPGGISKPANKSSPAPRRSPPPPPSANEPVKPSKGGGAGQVGAFWSTQHAKSSSFSEDNAAPKFDEESTSNRAIKIDWSQLDNQPAPASRRNTQPQSSAKDFEINFFKKDAENGSERPKASQPPVSSTNSSAFQDEAFSTFVADFDNAKLNSSGNKDDSSLEAEVEKLKEQLKQANAEKSEITSKYEKLSAICRSQRQELQELKQALAAAVAAPSPNTDAIKTTQASRVESSPPTMQREKYGGNTSSPNTESKSWQAFPEEPKPQQQQPLASSKKSVRMRNSGNQNSKQVSDFDSWGFGAAESFTATPTTTSSSQISRSTREDGASQRFGELKTKEGNSSASQPAGWAGF